MYSLAILLREEGLLARTLIYATDINAQALRAAEAGVYALDRIAGFTENHRQSGARTSLSDYYSAAYGRAVGSHRWSAVGVQRGGAQTASPIFSLASCSSALSARASG